jgi:hypothetical protein
MLIPPEKATDVNPVKNLPPEDTSVSVEPVTQVFPAYVALETTYGARIRVELLVRTLLSLAVTFVSAIAGEDSSRSRRSGFIILSSHR